ncbi:MAG: hypothetical protein ACO1NQ_02470 [Flavobacteriales bacterium]
MGGLKYSPENLKGLCIRPEIDWGYERFEVTYAYNVHASQPPISGHMLTAALLFGFKVTELPAQ